MTVSIDQLFNGMKLIIDEYLESLYDSSSMQRSILSPSDFVIRDIDYLMHLNFVGVAHFSRRSISDALKAIKDTEPVGFCLELCPYRYEYLKRVQEDPFAKAFSSRKNELVTAIDLLGGLEMDVWLIDMNQEEIAARVLALASLEEAKAWKRICRVDEEELSNLVEGLNLGQKHLHGLRLNLLDFTLFGKRPPRI
jgi:hypothetical protein